MKRFLVVAAFLFLLIPYLPLTAQTPNAAAYLNYGNQLYAAKDYAKAVSYYKYATTLDPTNAAAFQGLGNSYYQLGQKPEALAAYQQCKTLNPSNTQLDPVIQYLQSQTASSVPGSPASTAAAGIGMNYKNARGYSNGKFIEIEPFLSGGVGGGVALPAADSEPATTVSYGTGFGGGAAGYYLLDPHFGIGLKLAYLSFGGGPSSGVTYNNSGYNFSVSSSMSMDVMEIAPSIKYAFDGNQLKPYLTASLGFAMLSSSSTNTFNPGNLPSYLVSEVQSLYQTGSTSATDTDPMVEIGVGGEYSLGQDMSLFLQIEYSMIFDSGTSNGKTETATFSYIPITAGLNFDL
jgi:hypothetical protein